MVDEIRLPARSFAENKSSGGNQCSTRPKLLVLPRLGFDELRVEKADEPVKKRYT